MTSGNPILKSVNRSRPEIFKSLSKQSIAATDEYQSCGDYATEGSSSLEDPATVVRWSTPPSQPRSTAPTPDNAEIRNPSPTSRRVRADLTAPAIAEGTETRSEHPRPSRVPLVQATGRDPSPPTPGVDDTPYIHYAIEQITRDGADPRSRRPATVASDWTYPVDRIVPAVNLIPPPPPPKPVERSRTSSGAAFQHGNPQTLIPVDPPRNSLRYPQLTFLPAILRPASLMLLIFLCLLMIAALIFCAIWSRRHGGLGDYTDFRGGRYFLFGFLPQMLASIIVLYLLSVKLTVMRVLPFISMASDSVKLRSNALLVDMRPTSLVLPQVGYFRTSHPIIASCLIIFWLSVFTIPLQSSLFQVRWFQTKWRWVTVEGIAWTLVALYAILSLALIMLASFLFRKRTGLKWDPSSLADLVVLLQHSNSLHDYEGSETFRLSREFHDRLKLRSERLGYWRTRESRNGIFYAIGEEGAPTRRYSLQQGKIKKYPLGGEVDSRVDPDLEGGQQPQAGGSDGKLSARIRSPLVRYRFIPWYLRDTYIVAWIVTAIVLLIAFLVVSFVHHAVRRGFLPRLDATPNAAGFSPPGFLYSFLPSLIGLALFLFWYSIDINFRALQPFADLSNPKGAPAEKSLLLDYPSCLPVEVSVKAAAAGHWKVAWISFVSLLSITLPILGGGVFWAIYFPQAREVRIVAQMPAFGALVTFLVLYALSFLFIWPRRMRYLPHDNRTLAQLISFIYRSPLLRDRMFQEPLSKTDLVTRLVSLAPGEKEPRRYYFGIYQGLDRKEHLGIDWFQRYNSEVPRASKDGMI